MLILRKYSSTVLSYGRASTRRAHLKKGDQAIGRSRGGLSTKIHALVEGLGIMARFRLTPGQAGDNPQALSLLDWPRANVAGGCPFLLTNPAKSRVLLFGEHSF
jgi:hypothetical protein